MMRVAHVLAGILGLLTVSGPVFAEQGVAKLALDGLSFVSFDGRENYPIPPGGSIAFRFQESDSSTLRFTIDPAAVVIPPIPVADQRMLSYALTAPTTGVLRGSDARVDIEFTAMIQAVVRDAEGRPVGEALPYTVRFTTKEVSASDVNGSRSLRVEGAPMAGGSRYVQLVGAVTNKTDAFPEPGVAVYAVLSGSFDSLPQLP